MNTKVVTFVLALSLAAIACSLTGPRLSVEPLSVVAEADMTTFTPTAEPSLTYTNTPVPPTPTETRTPRPPTNTPTPLEPVAKVIGEAGVNVRIGPCNQPILVTAPLGMEFPVTGRYTSPNGYTWWRITLTSRTGKIYEGWVFGDLVEVTHAALVPQVASHCPSFTTTPPTPTQAQVRPPTTLVTPVVLPACQTRTWEAGGNGTGRFLWPDLVQGDREFDGNGPNVTIKVYFVIDVSKGIWGRILMWAQETEVDWSTAQGDTGWFRLHAGAPAGWRINAVNLSQVDPATGFYYSEWSYTDDDHDVDVYRPQNGGPVRTFVVRGDTKGDDIGSGDDDTHVLVGYNRIRVELIQEGNCQ